MNHPASANPKHALGSAKLPLSLWPETATAMGCLGLLEGMTKYGQVNFRATPVLASIYVDALKRHVGAFVEGEEVAPDSGIPHLANALACIAILIDAKAHGTLIDDRPFTPTNGYRQLVEQLTPHVERIKALHADKSPRHYTIADNAPAANDPAGFPSIVNVVVSNVATGTINSDQLSGLAKKSLASEMAWK